MDNKKFIVYSPAILLANKRSYLATKPPLDTRVTRTFRFLFLRPCRMVVGPWDVTFDLGIKRLLCDDSKDDESIWGRDGILVNTTTSTDMDFAHDEHDWCGFHTWQTRLIRENIKCVALCTCLYVCIIDQSPIYDNTTYNVFFIPCACTRGIK